MKKERPGKSRLLKISNLNKNLQEIGLPKAPFSRFYSIFSFPENRAAGGKKEGNTQQGKQKIVLILLLSNF